MAKEHDFVSAVEMFSGRRVNGCYVCKLPKYSLIVVAEIMETPALLTVCEECTLAAIKSPSSREKKEIELWKNGFK
jgi:hypothetical protein